MNLTLLNLISGIPSLNSTSPKAYSRSWNIVTNNQLNVWTGVSNRSSAKNFCLVTYILRKCYKLKPERTKYNTIVTRRMLVPGLTTSISIRAWTRDAQSPFTMCTMDASIANWCFFSIRQSKPKSRNLEKTLPGEVSKSYRYDHILWYRRIGTSSNEKGQAKKNYPIWPEDVYRKFPECGSACNRPVSRSWTNDASTPLLTLNSKHTSNYQLAYQYG
jgi:hypothetical protein